MNHHPIAASPLSSADFALLLDAVVDYAFITLGLDNRITAWNRGAERLLGYCESEILNQSAAVFFTPEDRAAGAVEREIETARRDGSASDERWHVRKDGSTFWASGVLTLVRDERGCPRGYVKVMRDLTAARQAGEALRQSEEALRLFVENVRDQALFLVDPQARVASWNSGAERLFGYNACEILGRPVQLLIPPQDGGDGYAERELSRALAQGRVEGERWLARRDGTQFFAAWVTYRMTDEAGNLRGFANVLRDETERLHVEQERRWGDELERAELRSAVDTTGAELDHAKEDLRALSERLITTQEEERGRIARELHDDVGQRLALLENGMGRIAGALALPDRLAAELGRLRDDVASIAELVRGVSHRLHPSILEHMGLVPALRSLVEEFRSGHAPHPRFIVGAPPDELPLSAATAVYRITQEALRNVARHAPGALATVTLSQEPSALTLRIDDDGPGFRPEAVAAAGKGLGLVSMRERARMVNGSVTVQSAPGAGVHVEMRIPFPPRA